MNVDIERLKEDIMNECAGAYFAGGFGGAIIELSTIQNAPPERVIEIAKEKGINLSDYSFINN